MRKYSFSEDNTRMEHIIYEEVLILKEDNTRMEHIIYEKVLIMYEKVLILRGQYKNGTHYIRESTHSQKGQ